MTALAKSRMDQDFAQTKRVGADARERRSSEKKVRVKVFL